MGVLASCDSTLDVPGAVITPDRRAARGPTPTGEVLRLALPAVAHLVLVLCVFVVDRALVGRTSATALASLQISTTLTWTICSLFAAIGTGTLAVVGRAIGAGDPAAARLASRAAVGLAVGLGVAVTVPIAIAGATPLRAIFPQAEAAVIADAQAYLGLALPLLPLAFLEIVAAACLQAAGDTRTPLVAAVIGNLVNLLLSAVLIFGRFGLPALGVRGAAIGAVAAFAIQGTLLSAVVLSPRGPFRRARGESPPAPGTIARLLGVSGGALGERLAYHGGYLAYVAMIGLLGAGAMAANQAILSLEALGCQTADGFGVAAAALTAQHLGERRPEAARACARAAAWLAVLSLSCAAVVLLAAPRRAIGLFSTDPGVVELGVAPLYIACLAQPPMAVAVVLAMALRGAGDTRTVLRVTVLSSIVVRLGVTWVCVGPLRLGLLGAWIGSTADWVVRAALLAGRPSRDQREPREARGETSDPRANPAAEPAWSCDRRAIAREIRRSAPAERVGARSGRDPKPGAAR